MKDNRTITVTSYEFEVLRKILSITEIVQESSKPGRALKRLRKKVECDSLSTPVKFVREENSSCE